MAEPEKQTTPMPEAPKPQEQKTEVAPSLNEGELREKLRERVNQAKELNEEDKKAFAANLEMIAKALVDGNATPEEEEALKNALPFLLEGNKMKFLNEDLEAYAKELLAKQAVETKEKTEAPEAQKLEAFAKAGFYQKHQPVPKVTGADFVEALKKDLQNFGLKQKEEIDPIDFTSIQAQIDNAAPEQKQAIMQKTLLDFYGKHTEQIKKYQENRPEEKFKTGFDDFINKIKDDPTAAAIFANVFEGIRDMLQEMNWGDFGMEAAVDKLRLGSYKKELEKTLENFAMSDDEIIEVAKMCRKLPKDNPNRNKFGDYVTALKDAYMGKNKDGPPGGKWEISHLKEAAGLLTPTTTPPGDSGEERTGDVSDIPGKKPEEFWGIIKGINVQMPETYAEFEKNHGDKLKGMDPKDLQEVKDKYGSLRSDLMIKIHASKYFDIPIYAVKAIDATSGRMTFVGHGDQEYQLIWQKNPAGSNDNWSVTKTGDQATFATVEIDTLRKDLKTKLLPPGPAETPKPATDK